MVKNPFHLAFPVYDLAETRRFYLDVLGCREGRSSDDWIDFDLFGHQVVAHRVSRPAEFADTAPSANRVDGKDVPVPHFGVVLDWDEWHEFAARLKTTGVKFIIKPYIRFAGQTGEQATLFFLDPSGNALEFKALRDPSLLFAD